MEISKDTYQSDVRRTVSIPAGWYRVLDIVRRLTGFFVLSKEDLVKAGVYINAEGRDG